MKWGPWNLSSLRILTSAVLLLNYPLDFTCLSVFRILVTYAIYLAIFFCVLLLISTLTPYLPLLLLSTFRFPLLYSGLFSFVPLTSGTDCFLDIFRLFRLLYAQWLYIVHFSYVLSIHGTEIALYFESHLLYFRPFHLLYFGYQMEVISLFRLPGWPMFRCRSVLIQISTCPLPDVYRIPHPLYSLQIHLLYFDPHLPYFTYFFRTLILYCVTRYYLTWLIHSGYNFKFLVDYTSFS